MARAQRRPPWHRVPHRSIVRRARGEDRPLATRRRHRRIDACAPRALARQRGGAGPSTHPRRPRSDRAVARRAAPTGARRLSLLLFSATLRPALFAPTTGASALLRAVSLSSDDLKPVYGLATRVADHADRLRGVRLHASLFRSSQTGGWQEQFDTLTERVAHGTPARIPSATSMVQRPKCGATCSLATGGSRSWRG